MPHLNEPAAAGLAALLGFGFGSIPWGVVVLRLAGRPDPRGVGSGNIGATNVTRAGGRGLGAVVLLLDAAKAWPAILLAAPHEVAPAAAGLSAVLGHCFTPWLRFRGGKGVATFLGAAVVLLPIAALTFLAAWIGLFAASRISAVAGVGACAVAAGTALVVAVASPGVAASAAAAALVLAAGLVAARHRTNFAKLAEERRLRVSGGRT